MLPRCFGFRLLRLLAQVDLGETLPYSFLDPFSSLSGPKFASECFLVFEVSAPDSTQNVAACRKVMSQSVVRPQQWRWSNCRSQFQDVRCVRGIGE
jgi:hypothetical protein